MSKTALQGLQMRLICNIASGCASQRRALHNRCLKIHLCSFASSSGDAANGNAAFECAQQNRFDINLWRTP